MTRISSIILVAAVLISGQTSIGDEPVDPLRVGAQTAATTSVTEIGVEAVYCFNVSIPSMDQAGVIYVTYFVTKTDWAAHMDWDIGFINGMFAPPLVSTSIHKTDNGVEFYSPYMNQRSKFVFGNKNTRGAYNSQTYGLTELAHSFDEARIWRIPETAEQAIAAIDPGRIKFSEIPYTGRNLTGEFNCRLVVSSHAGKVTQIRQSVLEDWERIHGGFQQFNIRGGSQVAATECRLSSLGDRFLTFNEYPERSILGDHPRHSETGLLFHRGGRHIRTSWKQMDDVVVPRDIVVTLGTTGSGMLLRSARLLSSRVAPETEIRGLIEKLRHRTSTDAVVANLGKAVGRQFWKMSPDRLDDALKMSAEQFQSQYTALLAEEQSAGDRIGLLRGRVLLSAATLGGSRVTEFKRVLSDYTDLAGHSAGPEGQTALLFNLLEMLRFWERPDLEEFVIQELTQRMEQQPPARQIQVLLYARGATETSDIHAHQLLDALSRSLQVADVPEYLVVGGLVLASLRLQSSCNGLLSVTSEGPIKDPVLRTKRRSELLAAYSGLLSELNVSTSENLRRSSVRLQGFVQMLYTEGNRETEAAKEK